ncbi:MAG: hypothetical protein B7W97_00050, partial [Mycobacterium sp. 20-66-4]
MGNTQEVIALNSKLTAAEFVAAQQVLSGTGQTIKLNNAGMATGGTVTLNNGLLSALDTSIGGSIGSLTIAHGVKVIDTLSLLSISGNLSNYGSILTASGIAGSADTIVANNIFNAAGGHIGSYTQTPASPALYAADPILNAAIALTNNGTISSANNLTINAPVVYNVAAHNATASISATNAVNVNTAALTNSGSITSVAGNVNIASTAGLTVDNTSGLIQAKSGNINISTTNADLAVNNGTYQAQNINLKAGSGNLEAFLGEVDGLVNASGNNVHIGADSKNFNVGTVDASGDPLIFNQGGNVTLTSSITPTAGQDLTIVASQNVITDSTYKGLDTSSTTGNGGNVTIVAGANFTGDAIKGITVTGGSLTGGSINLNNAPATSINTSSTAGDAGYVQLVAFAGSAASSGTVNIPNDQKLSFPVAINATSTFAGGNNGAISVIAGGIDATSGAGININGDLQGGAITLGTYTPNAISGGAVFSASGTAASGINSFSQSTTKIAGDVLFNGNTYATGDININAGRDASNFGFQIYGLGPVPSGLDGINGTNITINAGRDVSLGNVFSIGGGGTGSGSFLGTDGGKGGNGGNVTITAGRDANLVGFINVSGGGGGGGAGGSETQA